MNSVTWNKMDETFESFGGSSACDIVKRFERGYH